MKSEVNNGERVARIYNEGLGAEPQRGPGRKAPGEGVREQSPLTLKGF